MWMIVEITWLPLQYEKHFCSSTQKFPIRNIVFHSLKESQISTKNSKSKFVILDRSKHEYFISSCRLFTTGISLSIRKITFFDPNILAKVLLKNISSWFHHHEINFHVLSICIDYQCLPMAFHKNINMMKTR